MKRQNKPKEKADRLDVIRSSKRNDEQCKIGYYDYSYQGDYVYNSIDTGGSK